MKTRNITDARTGAVTTVPFGPGDDPTPAILDELAEYEKERNSVDEVKADPFTKQFIKMTPAEVADYVDNNVANLADARILLKRMAVMLLLLARRTYR